MSFFHSPAATATPADPPHLTAMRYVVLGAALNAMVVGKLSLAGPHEPLSSLATQVVPSPDQIPITVSSVEDSQVETVTDALVPWNAGVASLKRKPSELETTQ